MQNFLRSARAPVLVRYPYTDCVSYCTRFWQKSQEDSAFKYAVLVRDPCVTRQYVLSRVYRDRRQSLLPSQPGHPPVSFPDESFCLNDCLARPAWPRPPGPLIPQSCSIWQHQRHLKHSLKSERPRTCPYDLGHQGIQGMARPTRPFHAVPLALLMVARTPDGVSSRHTGPARCCPGPAREAREDLRTPIPSAQHQVTFVYLLCIVKL